MATSVAINLGPNGSTQYPSSNGAWEKDVTVSFSGNYQNDQSESTVTAADLGWSRILDCRLSQGLAPSSTPTTANEVVAVVATDGSEIAFWLYENAAAGSPSAEKTDNEAFITGQSVRCTVVGY
jgi:hypothetical protein